MDTLRGITVAVRSTLLLTVLTGVLVSGSSSITAAPLDITTTVGEVAMLGCGVQGTMSQSDQFRWAKVTSPAPNMQVMTIYTDPPGKMDAAAAAPKDHFNVAGHYDLTISDVTLDDGGIYFCRLLANGGWHSATLVVIETPEAIISTVIEDDTTLVACQAKCGGPRIADIPPAQLPKIEMYIDGTLYPGDSVITESDTGIQLVRTEANYTAVAAQHGAGVLCRAYTTKPQYEVLGTGSLDIQFSVRNLRILIHTPGENENDTVIPDPFHPGSLSLVRGQGDSNGDDDEEPHDEPADGEPENSTSEPEPEDGSGDPSAPLVRVGQVLTCAADGNPEPDLWWEAVLSPGERIVARPELTILGVMLGYNEWKCIGSNTVRNSHTLEKMAMFNVDPAVGGASGRHAYFLGACALLVLGLISQLL